MLQPFARPSAVIPLCMSLAAFGVVLAHLAIVGTAREPDEGAAAHVFQLLIAAQIPIMAFFAFRWIPHDRSIALRVLVAQASAIAVALFPVWYFGL